MYGRPELDTLVLDDTGSVIDMKQRSFQAAWWLVRNFSDKGVISLWDGVGTVSCAAVFAGRDVVALEPDQVKVSHASARISHLLRREKLVKDFIQGDKTAGEM
jgi:hypothetical protein